MSAGNLHKQMTMPSDVEIRNVVEKTSPAMADLYLAVHDFVRDTLPDAKFVLDCKDAGIGYGARQFGYDGWGMGGIHPYSKWVSIYFMHGAKLGDPDNLLQGTGALMRHVKVVSLDDLEEKRTAIASLLREAEALHA